MTLMTYEEYVSLGEHKKPYIVRISAGMKHLFYFGEEHSFDPQHKQWEALRNLWSEFLLSTSGQSRVALVEGGVRPVADTEEEAILKNGGMGLVTFLANRDGMEVFSPEPNEKEERKELEKKFSRDEIQYYYFARVVGQWGRLLAPRPDFEEYIAKFLKGDERESEWGNYDFSLNAMKSLHEKFFAQQFNPESKQFFNDVTKPTELKTRINEVSRVSSIIRDESIVKEILRYWHEGKSIFAAYGNTHVVMQEPLLKELL